ncbi:MAG: glycosyltransferase [Sphingomonadales bacterium]|nr:glycosyltransferase [Sphingomonadales bacterium]
MIGKPRVLYISYDGMLEPLGQSQVITYLERLASEYAIHLVSFEKPADRAQSGKVAAVLMRLSAAGISWHPLTYHKAPTLPATLFDIAQGIALSLWLTARHRVRLVHARSYIPALIGWVIKLLTGTPLLFDMRGLWADERIDGGIWPVGGRIYRTVKRIEKTLLQGADHIVTLTYASKAVIAAFPYRIDAPIAVIPTCADLDRFTPGDGGKVQPFTLGYLGSIGTWYMFEEVLACFKLLRERRPDARLLVVNRNEQDLVRRMVVDAGIAEDAIELTFADHADVPAQVRRMSAGAAVIKPAFSKIASAPTKLAEYLGCGVPCLGNVGVGDMELMLETEGGGVALREFTSQERVRAVDRLLGMADDPATPAHCRKVALAHFSVADGAERYRAIYQGLLT